ncbi:Peptidase C48, SUMO/Sentrin/Ubl1 [Artemisia annua]|uniref:Peptidase C48, SUMO/Sentrin/Ubl1 n=1 Tax=Artemisia annua TaxID=35608 RepID=A0A2U1L8H9_ARTAN|nr:Peptidase C48, SUMO/Sentrin/Ubl1 [Artemisia annua]
MSICIPSRWPYPFSPTTQLASSSNALQKSALTVNSSTRILQMATRLPFMSSLSSYKAMGSLTLSRALNPGLHFALILELTGTLDGTKEPFIPWAKVTRVPTNSKIESKWGSGLWWPINSVDAIVQLSSAINTYLKIYLTSRAADLRSLPRNTHQAYPHKSTQKDEPKQTEVEDALKTVGLNDVLKETTTSTKGDTKIKTEEPQVIRKMRKKSVEKSEKSDSPSKRTRGANQKKFDEAYKKMKEAGKGKVNEGETADKEYIEVSEEEEKKAYKRKKVAGKRKVNEREAAGDEDIHISEEEELIEVITTRRKTKMYQTLRPRATSKEKKLIIEMGFGELIDFPIVEIPIKLAFFVINSLQTDTMSLKLPTGDITILPKTVKEIFGIPMGERMLERQEGERESDDPFFGQWKSQFPAKLKRITTRILSQVIAETTNTDYMFKMNFLMLFANTMRCCDNSSRVKYTVLKNVLENDNLVYLHYTRIVGMEVRRKVPAFKNWNSNLMKKRETIEVDRRKFGQVEVLEEMNEEEQSNQKERKDDEDENTIQEAGETGEQEDSAKNKDAANDNEDGNKSENKDDNEAKGTKEVTNQKNEAGETVKTKMIRSQKNKRGNKSKNEAENINDSKSLEEQSKALKRQHSDDEDKKMKKRKIKPSVYLQSPYGKTKVKVEDKLTKDEKLLGRSIFSMQGDEAETVFDDKDGNMMMRMSIQSLAPGLEVESLMIDIFASILNNEERFSTKPFKRHYFYTGMMIYLCFRSIIEKEKEKLISTQYDMFQDLLKLQMKEDLQKMQMEDVDLVFFPIISSDHYYLIVFNIQKGNAVIIDNIKSDATYDGKYKDNYDLVVRTVLYNK